MTKKTYAPAWLTARPIAHRGLHDWRNGVVENTLGAFRAAMDRNYAIECDLQISKDGEAVLFHDDTLDRVMKTSGRVKDFTTAELQQMPFRHSAERIPTLAETLALVDGKVPLVIELKPQWDRDLTLTKRAVALLEDYKGPYCLMSFDPDVVEALRTLSPATVRGFITDRALDGYYNVLPERYRRELRTLSCLSRMAPHFVSVDVNQLPWAPIVELRNAGMPVICWTVRTPEQVRIARRYTDQVTFEGYLA